MRIELAAGAVGTGGAPGWTITQVKGGWEFHDIADGATNNPVTAGGLYSIDAETFNVVYGDGLSAAATLLVPVYGLIDKIYFANNNGSTGITGLKIGTTLGGTDVVAAHNIGAGEWNAIPDAEILQWWPFKNGTGTLYVDAAVWGGSADLDLWVRFKP
jgi:hypothetical protein